MGDLGPDYGAKETAKEGLDRFISVEEKLKNAFNDDHSHLAADVYTRSFAPKHYAVFRPSQSGSSITFDNSTATDGDGSNSSTQIRSDATTNLATKEEGGAWEIAKKVAVVAGVALVGWGISKLLGEDPSSESERKTMKAPGRDYRMLREVFENNPRGHFKANRDMKKLARMP